jgi:hypothetical protein
MLIKGLCGEAEPAPPRLDAYQVSGSILYSDLPLPHSFVKEHLHQYFRLDQYFELYPKAETKAVFLRQQSAWIWQKPEINDQFKIRMPSARRARAAYAIQADGRVHYVVPSVFLGLCNGCNVVFGYRQLQCASSFKAQDNQNPTARLFPAKSLGRRRKACRSAVPQPSGSTYLSIDRSRGLVGVRMQGLRDKESCQVHWGTNTTRFAPDVAICGLTPGCELFAE